MSNHREMEHADGFELVQIDVHGVNGEGFLHQTPEKTFSKRLPRKFRRNLVVIFHCSMSPASFHCEKASKSKAFMEKLRCPMSIQRLILLSAWKYLVRDKFLEFQNNKSMPKNLFWKEQLELMESNTLHVTASPTTG